MTVNPNNPQELIVASMASDSPIMVRTSDDGGLSWKMSSLKPGAADPALAYGANGTAYLTCLKYSDKLKMNFCTSTNNGRTWDSQTLKLDGMAADRQWMQADNSPISPFYGNLYISYFHPQREAEIHVVKRNVDGTFEPNHCVHSREYAFVQNPAIGVNNTGAIVICFLAKHADNSFQIMSVTSRDGSKTFSPESLVSKVHMYKSNGVPVTDVVGFSRGDSSRLQSSLQMAIDHSSGPNAGRVYLAWTDFAESAPDDGMDIHLSYSDDEGETWSSPNIVNDDHVPSSHQYFSAIDVSPQGQLCLSWYDRRVDPANDAITDFYFTVSSDGGSTFQPSIKLNSQSADHRKIMKGATTFGVGEYTSMATTSTHAHAAWSDGRKNDGSMDIYVARIELDNLSKVTETRLSSSTEANDRQQTQK